MDSKTIEGICLRVKVLKRYFCGVIKFENICEKKNILNQIGNFVICNINNAHWLLVQYTHHDTLTIFDTLRGQLTTTKRKLQNLFRFCFGVKNIKLVYPMNLQHQQSLVCGEHVLLYLIHQCSFYSMFNRFDENYLSKVWKYCEEHKITPDYLAWNQIYTVLKLADKPNLSAVFFWWYTKNMKQ